MWRIMDKSYCIESGVIWGGAAFFSASSLQRSCCPATGKHLPLEDAQRHLPPEKFSGVRNGSGKMTFANLLTGLHSANSGETILNGHSIGPEDREMYRQQFSVVFSDFFLFDDVVFVHQRTEDEVNRLLRLLQLEHKVSFRQGHFTTTLLSLGQRKRLALIQAWVEQRPFYVFDEWAADQDPEFRNVLYREILPMFKAEGKTVMAITHDDRFFHMADRIIKFDEGKQVLS